MVGFWVYDVTFLVLFTLFIAWFLYKRKNKLDRELGIMFIYRTKIGIRAINYVGDKFKRTLHVLKYFVIVMGFILMAGILYLIGHAAYTYIKFPQITQIIKAPPIAPLIPYFPKLFGLESFFPPFYFTYFILALAIVAIVHEFAHGIYMRLFKIKIKSTGFAALGPILGAFVEEDKGQTEKKKKLEQMSVLGAGTFANIVFALIFFLLMVGFFSLSFAPGGYNVLGYSCSAIPVGLISGVGNLSENFTEVYVGNHTYVLNEELKGQFEKNITHLVACEDGAAFRAGLKGQTIVQADGEKIKDQEDFFEFLKRKNPGEEVNVKTLENEDYNLLLKENPSDKTQVSLGLPYIKSQPKNALGSVVLFFANFKNPTTHYVPTWNEDLAWFIYYLFFWVALINFFVALFNMLPLGILDGGRFFYLTVFSITKSKKVAKGAFKFISYLILLMFIIMIAAWWFAL